MLHSRSRQHKSKDSRQPRACQLWTVGCRAGWHKGRGRSGPVARSLLGDRSRRPQALRVAAADQATTLACWPGLVAFAQLPGRGPARLRRGFSGLCASAAIKRQFVPARDNPTV
jgi:hypothetical protein